MNPRRTLVVFFSRTGTTRAVAQNLSSALKSDIEEIKEKRSGILNSLRFRFDVKRGKCAPIEALEKNPSSYELVIVGTPIWNGSATSAVKTYLSQNNERLGRVAFLCTCEASSDGAFKQMQELCGRKPLALLELKSEDVGKMRYSTKIAEFVKDLSAS